MTDVCKKRWGKKARDFEVRKKICSYRNSDSPVMVPGGIGLSERIQFIPYPDLSVIEDERNK